MVVVKVDYLVIWVQFNGVDFEYCVIRLWQCDLIFYYLFVQRILYVELLFEGVLVKCFFDQLWVVLVIVEWVQENFIELFGEFVDLVFFYFENFDGVGQGQLYCDELFRGMFVWYDDFCGCVVEYVLLEINVCVDVCVVVVLYCDWLCLECLLM